MSKLLDKISDQYSNKLPFVCFRKPKESTLKGYFYKNNDLDYTCDYQEEGFVFAPFDQEKPSIMFLSQKSKILSEDIGTLQASSNTDFKIIYQEEEQHISLVEKGIETIKEGEFKKVVLSRKEVLELNKFELESAFKKLLNLYQNAMVYIWFHPEVGLWMGATPERLVSLTGNQFETMALAGTQVFDGDENPDWGEKETEEHQYVVDYIVSQIQDSENKIYLKEFSVSETYTSKAGSLLHLKADIKGTLEDLNIKQLVKALHPTPAVCGLPKKEAYNFIGLHEGYDRRFYTGFLGELNIKGSTELFVNLRCMELENGHVVIYVGGGVTSQSDALKEWQETQAKTETIKRIL